MVKSVNNKTVSKVASSLGITSFSSLKDLFIQFIKFGIVGFSNTIISVGIYYLCVYFGMFYLLANTVGFLVSIVNAYFWNAKYVFNKEEESVEQVGTSSASSATQLSRASGDLRPEQPDLSSAPKMSLTMSKSAKLSLHLRKFSRMFTAYLITFLLTQLLLVLFISLLGVSTWIAPILCWTITIPANFLMNRMWVFKKHSNDKNTKNETDKRMNP
jgi:putative flippase GtrA